MFLLRFKRHNLPNVFLTDSDKLYPWDLHQQMDRAFKFSTKSKAIAQIEAINQIVIPRKAFDFDERVLFLIRLYGDSWDDQAEGLLVDMVDIIKAQILDENLEVVETHRMRNQTWTKHYG